MAAAFYSDFELIIPKEAKRAEVELGSEITIPCRLSTGGQYSVVTDIKWFKETDLVCHYTDRQVTEGTLYENRVRLLTEEINKGNVSLSIKDFKETDLGDYLCQVTCGNRTKEITIRLDVKLKRPRNRPPSDGVLGFIAAAAAAVYDGIATAAAAVVAFFYRILFSEIARNWSEQEREEMERSFLLAVRKCSEQARQTMEGSAPLTERRNSMDRDPPWMSGE